MIEFSDREKAIGLLALAIGVSVGLWMGVWSVPAEALDVPTVYNNGSYSPVYRPVTTGMVVGPIIFVGLAILQSRMWLTDDDLDDDPDENQEENHV